MDRIILALVTVMLAAGSAWADENPLAEYLSQPPPAETLRRNDPLAKSTEKVICGEEFISFTSSGGSLAGYDGGQTIKRSDILRLSFSGDRPKIYTKIGYFVLWRWAYWNFRDCLTGIKSDNAQR